MATSAHCFQQTNEFLCGKAAEERVAKLLQKQGWYVTYVCDPQNGSPRLRRLEESIVLPDLDVCKDGLRYWVEVKWKKNGADWTRVTQRYEHGIYKDHNDDYLKVQALSGTKVRLAVVEGNTCDILLANLGELQGKKRVWDGSKPGYRNMIYFPRDAFKVIGNTNQMDEDSEDI